MRFIFKYKDLDSNKNEITKDFVIEAINHDDFTIIQQIHEEIIRLFPVKTLYKKDSKFFINNSEVDILHEYMPNLNICKINDLNYITEEQFKRIVLYLFNKIGAKYKITFTLSEIPVINSGIKCRLLDIYKKQNPLI